MHNPSAENGIRDILVETYDLHGWSIPQHIINYQVQIFANMLAKNPWEPEPSYAERYLQLRTAREALELANTCYFTRSVFPELKMRRGIQPSYYVQLGQSCYDMVLQTSTQPTLRLMRDHFEFLAECAYTAIRHWGDFREMWD